MDATVSGMENFPRRDLHWWCINHLGDADTVLLGTSIPYMIEAMGKIELNDHWLVGPLFRAYGIIWVHRGRPDRKALRAALDGLAEGRMVTIAPEGQRIGDRGLEEGSEGAAFLALKSGAPIIPDCDDRDGEQEDLWKHEELQAMHASHCQWENRFF